MTKRFLIFIQILILSLLLVACGGGSDPCDECKDTDGDGFCDTCDEAMPDDGGEEGPPHTTCVDENPKDAKCDVCGKGAPCTTCVDANPKDAKCDVCNKDVPCADHINANEDRKCDVCAKDIPICAECADANENEKCDVCGSLVEPAEKPLYLIKDGKTVLDKLYEYLHRNDYQEERKIAINEVTPFLIRMGAKTLKQIRQEEAQQEADYATEIEKLKKLIY